jgi:hypothetical protein
MLASTAEVLSALGRLGLLVKQDRHLPNAVTLVTGETVSRSWWSHPQAQAIFAVISELAAHSDVLVVKLIHGKDTFVHRSLRPSLLTVATAAESWQWDRLPSPARQLLGHLDRARRPLRCQGQTVRDLRRRLFVYAEEVHTESGRHEMQLGKWALWAKRNGVKPTGSLTGARRSLEDACELHWEPLARRCLGYRKRRRAAGFK